MFEKIMSRLPDTFISLLLIIGGLVFFAGIGVIIFMMIPGSIVTITPYGTVFIQVISLTTSGATLLMFALLLKEMKKRNN